MSAQYQLFPDLSDDEYQRLKDDIRQRGVLVAVEYDAEGNILDGHHRVRAWEELTAEGVALADYPRIIRLPMTEAEKRRHVLVLNLMRRHLTREQRAEVFARLRADGMTLEDIADKAGVGVGTVHRDLNSAFPSGKAELPERVTGADGKAYPTQYAPRKAKDDGAAPTFDDYTTEEAFYRSGYPREDGHKVGTGGVFVRGGSQHEEAQTQIGFVDTETGEIVDATALLLRANATANGRQKPKENRAADDTASQPFDFCQTPPAALDPLLPYLDRFPVIWEPASGEGLLVEALYDSGVKSVVSTDILTGHNFFDYEPDAWDALVTNPPYSLKYRWLERCYALGKPFALLLPVETLGAKTAQEFFRACGLEVIFLDRRINFKMPNKGWAGSAQFPVAWFTWGLGIGQQMTFARMADDKL